MTRISTYVDKSHGQYIEEEKIMPLPVSLATVADELELISDDLYVYINKKSGELVTVSNDDLVTVETGYELEDIPEWQLDLLATAEQVSSSDDYLQLPTSADIDEWTIMQEFCATVENGRQRRDLLDQIHGKGAFRKFKDALDRYGLRDEWFAFHKAALARIASNFLEEAGIDYVP